MISILYVDDEPGLLEVGKLFLERDSQFSVTTATSAQEALEILRKGTFHAIISDYQMPGMDGIEFLREVRKSGDKIPFIIFTGKGREEVVIQALNEGADFYLQKGGEALSQFTELSHKVLRAVSERQAEASIRDHERREADIINFLPDATFAIDTTGVVIAWNRAIEGMTGVKSEQMIGKGNYEYAIPFYRERRPILIDLVLNYDSEWASRYPNMNKEGDILISETIIPHFNEGKGAVLWFIASPLYNSQGTVVGAIESIRDITGRKRAEEDLLSANMEYTSLLNQIQDVYYRSDTEGKLVRASQSWATLLGYDDISECIGRSIADNFYINPPDREKFLKEVYQKGKVTNYEVIMKRKDGTPVYVETSSHLSFDPGGKIIGIEGTFRDITGRKREMSVLRIQLNLGLELERAKGLNETLKACLNSAMEISGMDSGGIYLVDEKDGSINLVISRNLHETFIATVSHYPSDSVHARIIRAGKPEYVKFNEYGVIHTEVQEEEGLKVIAIVPIEFGGKIIACMNISSHTLFEIPPYTRIALETIATQIGAAIERSKIEKALAESEQRYRNVVEDQTEFISRFLPDGTHVFANNAYCRYFGLQHEQIVGHRFRPKIAAEDRERISKFFASLTFDNPVGVIEHRITMPDGSTRWQRWSDRAIFDPSGKVIEYQSVGRDITDSKEIEQALYEKDAWSRSLSELSPDLIFMIDRDDRITYVNKASARMMGLPSEEIIGRERSKLFPADVSAHQQEAVQEVFRTGEVLHSSGKIVFRGEPHWFDHSLVPVRDKSGMITGVLGVSREITEQKIGEEALRTRTEDLDTHIRILNTLLDTVPIGIFMVEHSYERPIFANREAIRLLGPEIFQDTPGESHTGTDAVLEGGIPRRYVQLKEPILRGLKGESSQIDDIILMKRDGGSVQLDIFGTPVIDRDDRVIGCLVTLLDITSRKREERLLKEMNKKIQLLASITRHDIANQISIIQGFAKIAMMDDPDPRTADLLSKINAAGATISEQIAFMKTYEKLGIHAPGWYAVDEITTHLDPGDILLTSDCHGIEIFADPMLEKVFSNLVDNSYRHGGRVALIKISCDQDPDGLTIFFEDDGVGVPDEIKDRIFEKGYGKNTGFGLFLSREILAITDIAIRETGIPGQGARFEMHVPKGRYRRVLGETGDDGGQRSK